MLCDFVHKCDLQSIASSQIKEEPEAEAAEEASISETSKSETEKKTIEVATIETQTDVEVKSPTPEQPLVEDVEESKKN